MEYEIEDYEILVVEKTSKEGKVYHAIVLRVGSVEKVLCFLNTDQYNFITSSLNN